MGKDTTSDEKVYPGKVIFREVGEAEFFVPHKQAATLNRSQLAIYAECRDLADFLLEKNINYGNSFAEPLNVYSQCSPDEQLNVRIDDKLKRRKHGKDGGEDTDKDLIGYLILKRVLKRLEREGANGK